MLIKEKVIKSIETMSDSFELEDLLEQILLLEKIEKGLKQSENNSILSDEEMEERIESWLV